MSENPVTFTPEQLAALGLTPNDVAPEQIVTAEEQQAMYDYSTPEATDYSYGESPINYGTDTSETPVTYTPTQEVALGIVAPPEQQVTQEEQAQLYDIVPPAPEYETGTRPEDGMSVELRQDIPGGGSTPSSANLSTTEIQAVESVPTSAGAYVPSEVLATGNITEVVNSLINNNAPIATIQMYLTGQDKGWNDIDWASPAGQAIAAQIPVINAQINEYNSLSGEAQFNKGIQLGFIPTGSEYQDLGNGQWGFITPLVQEYITQMQSAAEARSTAREQALTELAEWTTDKGIFVGQAAAAGKTTELLTLGFTVAQIKEELAKLTPAINMDATPNFGKYTMSSADYEHINEIKPFSDIKNLPKDLLNAFWRLSPEQQQKQAEATVLQSYQTTGQKFGSGFVPVKVGVPIGLQALLSFSEIPVVGSPVALIAQPALLSYKWDSLNDNQKKEALITLSGQAALAGLSFVTFMLAPKPISMGGTYGTEVPITPDTIVGTKAGYSPLSYEQWAQKQVEASARFGEVLDMGTSAYNAYLKTNATVSANLTVGEVMTKVNSSGFKSAASIYGQKAVEASFGQPLDVLLDIETKALAQRGTTFSIGGETYKIIMPEDVQLGLPTFDTTAYLEGIKQGLTGKEAFVQASGSPNGSTVPVYSTVYEAALHQTNLIDKIPTIAQTIQTLEPNPAGGIIPIVISAPFKDIYGGSFQVQIPGTTLDSISLISNTGLPLGTPITIPNTIPTINALPAPTIIPLALPMPNTSAINAPISTIQSTIMPETISVTQPVPITSPETVPIITPTPETMPITLPEPLPTISSQPLPAIAPEPLPSTVPNPLPKPVTIPVPEPIPEPIPEPMPVKMPQPVPPLAPIPVIPIIKGGVRFGGSGSGGGTHSSSESPSGMVTFHLRNVWYVIKYPYKSKNDVLMLRVPPKGAIHASGAGSAYKTIKLLTGIPPTQLFLDAGIMDIAIRQRPTDHKLVISFKKDKYEETTGNISLKGIRL
jgi:hypothetical protein